jgi:eukaryotic-like serine/threonine-protein kinase
MNHSTETLLRIEAIFNEAVAVCEDERTRLLEARCNGDAEMIAEVRSLLRACAAEEHSTASRRSERRNGKESLFDRKRVGPYEIDRLLGRGGMGAVYLAHRADGQFERQVAIKLIDLPLATDLFRERFRQERQILAGLQHPYIARLLDGGVTSEGEPYLAMEYVEGVPINRFCQDKALTTKQRLELFESVCEAVQYAHQNLVVHRDLKPDNILVVQDGTPRLLDFGTAKLLSPSQNLSEGQFTRHGYQSFTPQYASPEQVLGNPVTTASDTYSLGVLLYLLLTGTLPYELKEFTTAEMVGVICHEPPHKPTTGDSSRPIDPDLEAIVLKALRKEPSERYLTAAQLGADVRSYLLGQPVTARRGTFRYRAGKFVRRNRLSLTAAALITITLISGIAGILWQSRLANRERRKAEARSSDLRQLSNSLLSELDEALKEIPGSTGVQKLLVDRVLEHLDRMAQDAHGDRQTQLDLADAYTRLGDIQGNGYDQNLGDKSGALTSIGKAIDVAEKLTAANPKDREALRALARAQASRGTVRSESHDVEGGVADLRAATQTYDRLIALPGATPTIFFDAAVVNSKLGDVLGQDTGLADLPAALTGYRKARALDASAFALDTTFLRAQTGMARMQMKIGNGELDIDPAQALIDFQLALRECDALPESERNSVEGIRTRGITIRKIAAALSELGEYSQAQVLFEQSLNIHSKLANADPKDLRNLADIRRALQQESDAAEYAADPALAAPGRDRRLTLLAAEHVLQQYEGAIERSSKFTPNDLDRSVELANARVRIAAVQHLLRQPGNSAQTRAALNFLKSAAAKPDVSPMILECVVLAFLSAQPESLRDPQFALAVAQRGVTLTHRKTPQWFVYLAQTYRQIGRTADANAAALEGLALLPPVPPGVPKCRTRKLLEREATRETQKAGTR